MRDSLQLGVSHSGSCHPTLSFPVPHKNPRLVPLSPTDGGIFKGLSLLTKGEHRKTIMENKNGTKIVVSKVQVSDLTL